jgi:hypothetical protein
MEKTLEIHLKELREQIAEEIEDYLRNNIDIQPWVDVRNFRFCAKIARGIHNG